MKRGESRSYSRKDHTFVICAYGESPFLEKCILSLKNQTISSKIIITTSTPNALIVKMAEKYQLPLYINEEKKGIAADWNFGCNMCKTKLVTLAHQDDIYEPWYIEKILNAVSGRKRPLLIFTDYGELRREEKIDKNHLLRIKRILLLPLKCRQLQGNRWIRRRVLSIGSPISCPTVTYVKENLPENIFQEGYSGALDWQAWEQLSKLRGEFIYCSKICMYHRIHENSATSTIIANHRRSEEDFAMFCKFWPLPIAKIISKWYHLGEASNDL